MFIGMMVSGRRSEPNKTGLPVRNRFKSRPRLADEVIYSVTVKL
jgi:hypothetical protein